MRFYKIINPEKIKNTSKFLSEKEKVRKENFTQAKIITPFEWEQYLRLGSSWFILPKFLGFEPKNKIEAPEGWKYDKEFTTMLVCDKRTKKGRENAKFLDNLPNYFYHKILEILNIKQEICGRFTIPTLFFSDDNKEIYLKVDDKMDLDKSDFLEVTRSYIDEKVKD